MKSSLALVSAFLLAAGCQPGVIGSDSGEGSDAQGLRGVLKNTFELGHFELTRYGFAELADALSNGRALQLATPKGSIVLEFEPNDLRAATYRAQVTTADGTHDLEPRPPKTFAGHVVGQAGSQARFATVPNGIEGYFTVGGERVYVQPARVFAPHAAFAAELVTYDDVALRAERVVDVDSVPTLIALGETALPTTQNLVGDRIIKVATEADLEFTNQKGGAGEANDAAESVFNMIDGVYQSQLGLQIQLTNQHAYLTADPFQATNLDALLVVFREKYNASKTSVSRDVAHLFTAKLDPAGTPLSGGRGFIGAACRAATFGGEAAYSVTGRYFTTPTLFIGVAHEVGHVLGANHREADQPGCGLTIMNGSSSTSTQLSFCDGSRTDIKNYVATYATSTCIAPPPAACVPTTSCANMAATCGVVFDGCKNVFCGYCALDEVCGVGGPANVCAPYACTPTTTCAAQGATCGSIFDGCKTVSCGTCSGGETCGGGGTANVCGGASTSCTPYTQCASTGFNCGQVSDGCGGTLACGGCSSGETCGGGGFPNLCGRAPTTSTTGSGLGYCPRGGC